MRAAFRDAASPAASSPAAASLAAAPPYPWQLPAAAWPAEGERLVSQAAAVQRRQLAAAWPTVVMWQTVPVRQRPLAAAPEHGYSPGTPDYCP